MIRSIRREAEERHLVYQRDGVDEIIRLLPCPITLRPDQLGYTHYVSQTLLNCMKRLPDIYFTCAGGPGDSSCNSGGRGVAARMLDARAS